VWIPITDWLSEARSLEDRAELVSLPPTQFFFGKYFFSTEATTT
jgi:hypothetical protein